MSLLRPQHELAMEILALRYQITVFKRRRHRPKLRPWDRSLDDTQESLAELEHPVVHLPPRNRHRLATSRIQNVLAMEAQAAAWSTWEGPGIDPAHPPDVERQSDLGLSGAGIGILELIGARLQQVVCGS